MLNRQDRIQAIAAYLATPEEQRPVPTLKHLARRLQIPDNGPDWYDLAKSPEVAREMSRAIAMGMVDKVPQVLASLADSAIAGSSRAADVFLRHWGTLMQLDKAGVQEGAPGSPKALHVHLHDVGELAGKLNKMADALQAGAVDAEVMEAASGTDASAAGTVPPTPSTASRDRTVAQRSPEASHPGTDGDPVPSGADLGRSWGRRARGAGLPANAAHPLAPLRVDPDADAPVARPAGASAPAETPPPGPPAPPVGPAEPRGDS